MHEQCIQPTCHTHFMEERKRAFMEACEGSVSRCLVPAMNANGPLDRRRTRVEKSCIVGVPPPKGQRGLLVSAAAVVGARSQMEVGELSGMLAHTHACL